MTGWIPAATKGLFKFAAVDYPKAMEIDHDMIDPGHKNQQTEIVYPELSVCSVLRKERWAFSDPRQAALASKPCAWFRFSN